MTTQPAFCAFDLLSSTPATTPSPRRTSKHVPTTSPRNIWVTTSLCAAAPRRWALRRHIAKAVRIRKSKRDPTVTGPASSCYVRHRRTNASAPTGGGRFDSNCRADGMVPPSERCDDTPGRCRLPSGGGVRRRRRLVRRWIVESAARIGEQRDFLTQLDAAIGDADHGVNMQRGFDAALATLQSAPEQPPGALLQEVGTTLVYRVGGAAGPLFGTGFRRIGVTALGGRATGRRGVAVQPPRGARGDPGARRGGARGQDHGRRVGTSRRGVRADLALRGDSAAGGAQRRGGGERRRDGDVADAGAEGPSVLPRLPEHRPSRPGATSTALIFGALELAVRRA